MTITLLYDETGDDDDQAAGPVLVSLAGSRGATRIPGLLTPEHL